MIKPSVECTTGVYQVGNREFVNQLEALYYASTNNQTVQWNFYDHVFSQIDWSVRPPGTLAQLYRDRAQQIRDRYDYVAVYFSGGADSWNIVNSFLSNNIPIDEIVTSWSFAHEKYNPVNVTDYSEGNIISEYYHAALPVLDHIKKTYPNIRIEVVDYTKDLQATEFTESNFAVSNYYSNISAFHRVSKPTEGQLQAQQRGNTIGLVLGHDKIRYIIKDQKFYAHFMECMMSSDSPNYDSKFGREMFYWTPDAVNIPILQAHYLRDFFIEHPESSNLDLLDSRNVYSQVCYPAWNDKTFQVGKPIGTMTRKSDSWIHNYNPDYWKSWKWHMDQYYNSIDSKFLNLKNSNVLVGTRKFHSPEYFIGEVPGISNSKSTY